MKSIFRTLRVKLHFGWHFTWANGSEKNNYNISHYVCISRGTYPSRLTLSNTSSVRGLKKCVCAVVCIWCTALCVCVSLSTRVWELCRCQGVPIIGLYADNDSHRELRTHMLQMVCECATSKDMQNVQLPLFPSRSLIQTDMIKSHWQPHPSPTQ